MEVASSNLAGYASSAGWGPHGTEPRPCAGRINGMPEKGTIRDYAFGHRREQVGRFRREFRREFRRGGARRPCSPVMSLAFVGRCPTGADHRRRVGRALRYRRAVHAGTVVGPGGQRLRRVRYRHRNPPAPGGGSIGIQSFAPLYTQRHRARLCRARLALAGDRNEVPKRAS